MRKIKKDPIIVSDRNIPLILMSSAFNYKKPVLTVEAYSKWYCLYLIEDMGTEYWVSRVEYHDIQNYINTEMEGCVNAYVDHVPNPDAVVAYAEDKDYHLDGLADDLIAGRWYNEVVDRDRDFLRPKKKPAVVIPKPRVLDECRWCGKSLDEHRDKAHALYTAKMPCGGVKTGFRPKTSTQGDTGL